MLKKVAREYEPVEFRPIPGQEDEWAAITGYDRSRLWDWLGLYPVYGYIILMTLAMFG